MVLSANRSRSVFFLYNAPLLRVILSLIYFTQLFYYYSFLLLDYFSFFLHYSAIPIGLCYDHPLLRRQHLTSASMSFPGPGHRAASVGSVDTSSRPPSPSRDSTQNIIISHVNINSITSRCRLDELSHFSSLHDIDIICLSETKLDDQVHPSFYTLDNFHDPMTRQETEMGVGSQYLYVIILQ